MSISKQEFTDAGKSMLGRAQASETLTISKIVVGSGLATTPNQLWPLTALINKKLDVNISSKRDYGDGTMLVEGSFRSDQAASAFDLCELGVMAHVGTEADRLYSVANVFNEQPDHVDPASPSIRAFKIKLIIDRIPTAQVTVTIGPGEVITGENIGADTVGPGWYKEAIANLLRFKRAKAGTGIDIVEDTSGDFITISAKILKADLDVYVPASHPQCPNPSVGFPNIQAAHDYLLQWRIQAGKYARIHVYTGTFTQASLNFNHPDSQQIQVLGEPRVSYNVTRVDPISASQKKVTLDTTAHGLQVNQVVYIPDSILYYTGGCKVLSAPAGQNYVNVSVPYRGNRAVSNPYNTAYVAAHHMRRYTTIVAFNDATKLVLWNFPFGIGLIQNILVQNTAGSLSGYGLAIAGAGGAVTDCQIFGPMRRGISGGGDIIQTSGETVITDCDWGLTGFCPFWLSVSPAPGVKANTLINGCNAAFAPGGAGGAVAALIGGMPDVIAYFSHCSYGIFTSSGGQASGGAILIDTCDIGMYAVKNASIVVGTGTDQSVYMFNNTTDIYAQGMGYAELHYANNGPQNPICNPAKGDPGGNQNSYIYVTA